jgi:WD repeat and SOF domain-containing protein 1
MPAGWKAFDPSRNFPDLGPRFIAGERLARTTSALPIYTAGGRIVDLEGPEDLVADDKRDLDWATVVKRTFEAYIRGETSNMYGEWIDW